MGNRLTFKGGVHPLPKLRYGKYLTDHCAIETMPPVAKVRIPCAQHAGAPAVPIVETGQKVKLGEKIAEANGFVSVPVHASVSGTVTAITKSYNKIAQEITYIEIENDFQESVAETVVPYSDLKTLDAETIKKIVLEAGNVGLGGAGFPTHVKLSPPEGKKISTVIINGAECEPFLTADHRLMLEQPEGVIFGLKVLMKALDVHLGFIAIEDNKMDAAAALERALDTNTIRITTCKTKYPQGSEKQLIDAVLGRQVPSGGLPADVGVVVVNAASAKAIADAVRTGMPLVERIVTVTGDVNHPKNVLAKLGTPLKDLLEFCGGLRPGVKKLIAGGPMMGTALDSIDGVVSKTTAGILAFGDKFMTDKTPSNCIRCGRCAAACPIGLLPMYISIAADQYDFEKAEAYHAMDCIGCGSCSYVCPAYREIAQSIRLAKDEIAKARRKKQQK